MKISDAVAEVRAKPLAYAGWILVLIVLCAAGVMLGRELGSELYQFTH